MVNSKKTIKKISNVKILYHGTDKWFDKFDFNKAKDFKDFGKGFYLTSDFNQAQRWAQLKGNNESVAYIYCYELDNDKANKLKILELLYYDKQWLDFICKSRLERFETDYDIIYDRIADNHYSEISDSLNAYNNGNLSVEEAIDKIKWRSLKADQYCFKSEGAVSILQKKQSIIQRKDMMGRWLQVRC